MSLPTQGYLVKIKLFNSSHEMCDHKPRVKYY